jgi:hypothetical protein
MRGDFAKKETPSQPLKSSRKPPLHPRESQAVHVAKAVELPECEIANSGLDKRERFDHSLRQRVWKALAANELVRSFSPLPAVSLGERRAKAKRNSRNTATKNAKLLPRYRYVLLDFRGHVDVIRGRADQSRLVQPPLPQ